jgi:hypothetical protein
MVFGSRVRNATKVGKNSCGIAIPAFRFRGLTFELSGWPRQAAWAAWRIMPPQRYAAQAACRVSAPIEL